MKFWLSRIIGIMSMFTAPYVSLLNHGLSLQTNIVSLSLLFIGSSIVLACGDKEAQ